MLISSVSILGSQFACIMFFWSFIDFNWFEILRQWLLSFVSHVQSSWPVCTSGLQTRLCFKLCYLLGFQILPVLQGFFCLSMEIKHLSRLFTCAHWEMPFFYLDTTWSISRVRFLIFSPFSLVFSSFLTCHFFSFSTLVRHFMASSCLGERWKGDLTEKLSFILGHQASQSLPCQFALNFIVSIFVRRLWKVPYQFHVHISQILIFAINLFVYILISYYEGYQTWQQLAWRCMVADGCQGGHNCPTVPYAFLLLSKIGCLKL